MFYAQSVCYIRAIISCVLTTWKYFGCPKSILECFFENPNSNRETPVLNFWKVHCIFTLSHCFALIRKAHSFCLKHIVHTGSKTMCAHVQKQMCNKRKWLTVISQQWLKTAINIYFISNRCLFWRNRTCKVHGRMRESSSSKVAGKSWEYIHSFYSKWTQEHDGSAILTPIQKPWP